MKQLDFSQARTAVEVGGILSVNLRPSGPRFFIEFETRIGTAVLVRSNGKTPRPFTPQRAFETIRELGLDGGRFSLAQWRPEETELEKKARPDRAQALREAHQAKAHLDWMRDKAEASLADPAPNVGHDQVMTEAQAIIDAKRKQHAATA
ncbi:MAG: hypothetical protein EPN21_08580 [Methylococcaceae bacterium]|nr:MAG: hypothetical protein EPN21_08580 [Methylococcaceae bacterium]